MPAGSNPPGQRRPAPDQSAQPGPGAGGGQHRPHAADGRLALTGGGDIELRVGGALNPALPTPYESSGSVTNLRGQTSLQAASFGRLDPLYGVKAARDTRALDLFRAADVVTTGGIALYAGDSAFRLQPGRPGHREGRRSGPRPMLSMPYVQANGTPGAYGANTPYESSGSVTNRGQTSLQAASFGRLDPLYGVKAADTRALDLFRAADVVTTGGRSPRRRATAPGRPGHREGRRSGPRPMPLSMPYVQANGTPGAYGANTWFSLWTANTAIDLFSAGGNLTPSCR